MKIAWKTFDTIINYIIILCLSGIAVFIFSNIVARVVFNASLPWTDEACRYLFVITVSLGAGVLAKDNSFIAVDLIPEKLTGTVKFVYTLVLNVLIICMGYILLVYGFQYAATQLKMKQMSSAIYIPMSAVYIFISIGGLLVIVNTVRNIVQAFNKRNNTSCDIILNSTITEEKGGES